MESHEIDYQIIGDDLQFVEVTLDQGETVVAEAGAMMYMEEGIDFEAKMGDGSKPKAGMFDAMTAMGKRVLAGESMFMTHFTHSGKGAAKVAFSAPYPGKIIPVSLAEHGNEILCQKNAFLCAARGTEISIAFTKRFGAGLFGGEGFILQKLKGDGLAFMQAGGTIVRRRLSGEKLRLDSGCVVGFTSEIDYSIERAGNLKSMVFGGEGMFLATLQGHGDVWLQSLPFARLADRVIQNSRRIGGDSQGEGSVVGSVMKMFER